MEFKNGSYEVDVPVDRVSLKLVLCDSFGYSDSNRYEIPGNVDAFFFLGNVLFTPSVYIPSIITYRQSVE